METSQTETYKSLTAVSWELFGFTFSGQEAEHFIFCLSLYKKSNLTVPRSPNFDGSDHF